MAHLILSDGGPEASDYSSNYFEFNESDPQVLKRLQQFLCGRDHSDPEVRALVMSICRESLSKDAGFPWIPGQMISWIQRFFEKAGRLFFKAIQPRFTLH